MSKRVLYREYDENGTLIRLECCKCGEIKSVSCFYIRKTCKDGINPKCKECICEKSKERYYKNIELINKKRKIYRENNKEKIREYNRQYYRENNYKYKNVRKKYYTNNKNLLNEHQHQYYKNKIQEEINRIYENVTKNLYPNNGIQYGIIYGVHCINTDRWYIGQTTNSFNIRYNGDFFNCKNCELSEDNEKLQLLQDDIEKYGQESFEIFEVIDVAFSEKELDEKEVYYIDYYKAYDEGYNSYRGNIFKHEKSKRKDVI